MVPLPLLSRKDALDLACQAAADFPGLLVLLRPVVLPQPLTDHHQIRGFELIVAGPQGRTPWFTCTSPLAYADLYDRIVAQYDRGYTRAGSADDDEGERAGTPIIPINHKEYK